MSRLESPRKLRTPRKNKSRRGVATAIGAILFFVIALQIIAFLYEVNQVHTEMVSFDIDRARESIDIVSIGFNDLSPSSIQLSSGQILSGDVLSLGSSDSDRLTIESDQVITALHPSSYNLVGSTTLVSGGTSWLTTDDGSYMVFRSYVSGFLSSPTRAFTTYRASTGSGLSFPKGALWDGSSWSSEQELPDSGSPVRWVRSAYSPISSRPSERVVITLSDDGYLDAFVWDGSSWTVSNDIGFVGTSASSYRPFDISYEIISGDAMLVYGISSTDITKDLAYRVWDGNSWSGEAYLDDTTSAADIQYYWVQVASYALDTGRVNEIGLIATDGTDKDTNSWIWDGISWGNFLELTNDIELNTIEGISVEYEQISGDAMFIWGRNKDLESRKWTGSWQSQLPVVTLGGAGNEARWFSLKSDPTSNQLMAVTTNKKNLLQTAYWSGSDWTLDPAHDTDVDVITRIADFAWEPSGSKGLLVWGTTSDEVSWKTFDAPSTWSSISTTSTPGSGTHPWIQLRRNPIAISGDIMIYGATLNSNNELAVFDWDGNILDPSDFTTLSTSVASVSWESFDLQWRLFGNPIYILEVEFTGSGGHEANLLDWAVDSSWTVGDVNVTIQIFSYPGSIYADESSYIGGAHSNYDSDSTPNTDELEGDRIKEDDGPVSDFFDGSTNWKLKIRGEKQTDNQFDLRVDLVEYELEFIETDWAGVFSITETPAEIADLEITYSAFGQGTEITQEIYIYNFTGMKWDILGQFATTAIERTVGPLPAGGDVSDYMDGSSQVKVSVNGTSSDLYTIYSDYLHLRVVPIVGSGVITIEVLNSGGNDIHLVDLWILDGSNRSLWNTESSPPFDRTVFPGDSYSTSVDFDWVDNETYRVKVVSERGGIWSRVITP